MIDIATTLGLIAIAAALLFAAICIVANHMFQQRGLPTDEEVQDDL